MKAILLLSSGIDSPVAGYLMLEKNVEIIALHMDARPCVGEGDIQKAKQLIKQLMKATGKCIRFFSANNSAFHQITNSVCDNRFHCILCKRFMYRVAERLAEKEGAQFIITGESLGQVASQTLDNIRTLSDSISTPIIRPLIGLDKQETIDVARLIGTYEISTLKSSPCPFIPKKPATKTRKGQIEVQESKINMGKILDETTQKIRQHH
jgi:tRNA uracil 4-sulfurtransferase